MEIAYATYFLSVINSNFGRISYPFRDIDAFSSKIACFPNSDLVWHTGEGTPCDINIHGVSKMHRK